MTQNPVPEAEHIDMNTRGANYVMCSVNVEGGDLVVWNPAADHMMQHHLVPGEVRSERRNVF